MNELSAWIKDARACTLALVADLSDEQLRVAKLDIVNPLDWEIGHVAFFQERFALRDVDGRPSLRADADRLYDSIAVDHSVRWDLPLPPRKELIDYLRGVRDAVLALVARGGLDRNAHYRQLLAVFHEDMHDEAIAYTRQTMGYGPPDLPLPRDDTGIGAGALEGDARVPGGRFELGAPELGATELGAADGASFIFDNEQWAHARMVEPFVIGRAPVTQAELLRFVEDRGYTRRELWSEEGWASREREDWHAPVYWRHHAGGWQRRHFDRWVDLEPHLPAIHVSWYEADAYCRWAGRRLPTELEWEFAASAEPGTSRKRRYPWGDDPPTPAHVNMDARAMGAIDVGALPLGDSAFGCRQMIGNVWEWTSDTFGPYPGFAPGPYKEYSEPLFGTTKVLRGGAWITRARLIRNTWRNYYEPYRRDVWAGFRTCAL
ncbi:MAG TPA: selenoneine synthase SenA [Polyangiaceae bacterium]|nr:selenoneine synthase SenA [Polyangiaceae bacterium]